MSGPSHVLELSAPEPRPAERLALVVSALALVLLALMCLGSAAYSTAPWWTHPTDERSAVYRAGNFGLSIEITDKPGCSPLQLGCPGMTPGSDTYLSIWVSVARPDSVGATAWARPLLLVRIN